MSDLVLKGTVSQDGRGHKSVINRKVPLNRITSLRQKNYLVKGPVHNLHFKVSALNQAGTYIISLYSKLRRFLQSPQFVMTLFGGEQKKIHEILM